MNSQQLLNQGFQQLNSGNLPVAAQLFNQVLEVEPQNFAALNGRGFVALQQNRLPQSAADFQGSLAVNPKQAFAQKMLGIVLGAMGRFEGSMQAFSAALALDAKDPEVFFNRANFRFQAGQVEEALADLDAAIKLRGSYLEARSNRANLLIQTEQFARAEKDLSVLVNKITNNPDLWVALGYVRHQLGRDKEALQCFEKALAINPNHPDALMNSANAYHALGQYTEALSSADKALAVTPDRPEAQVSRGRILYEMGLFEASKSSYDLAIGLNSNYAEAWMGRGLANAALNDLSAALHDYDQAFAIRPDFYDAPFNKSHMLLAHRDFEQGWPAYEYRIQVPAVGIKPLPDIPIWDGTPLAGKLLVRGEQGLGDQILFASVLPDLLNRQPHVCLQLEPRLVPLFQRSFPKIDVMSREKKPPADVVAQVCIGSLPQYFRKNEADFRNAQVPYLKADPERTATLRKTLAPNGERIIGLNWRSFRGQYADNKSAELKDMAAIFAIPNCTIVNLQYGDVKDELIAAKAVGLNFNKSVSIDLTKDIDGVASLLDACEVVVSVSNSTAHIAGALGKPVLLMLPYRTGKLWYWSEAKGEGSLWYPTVKTYHQSAQGDWAGTIARVIADLQK